MSVWRRADEILTTVHPESVKTLLFCLRLSLRLVHLSFKKNTSRFTPISPISFDQRKKIGRRIDEAGFNVDRTSGLHNPDSLYLLLEHTYRITLTHRKYTWADQRAPTRGKKRKGKQMSNESPVCCDVVARNAGIKKRDAENALALEAPSHIPDLFVPARHNTQRE